MLRPLSIQQHSWKPLFSVAKRTRLQATEEVHRALPDARPTRLAYACLSGASSLLRALGNATLQLCSSSTRAQCKYLPTITAVAHDESRLAVRDAPTSFVDQLTPPTNHRPEHYRDAASQRTGALTTKPQARYTTGDATSTITQVVTHTATS